MADTDGKIQLALDVSPEDAIKSFKKLQSQAQKTFDSLSTSKPNREVSKLENSLSKSVTKADKLATKLEEVSSKQVPTEEYKQMNSALSQAEKTLNKLVSKQESWEDRQALNPVMDQYHKLLDQQQKYADLIEEQIKLTGEHSTGVTVLQGKYDAVTAELEKITPKIENIYAAGERINERVETQRQKVAELKNSVQELVDTGKAFTVDSVGIEQAKNALADGNNEIRLQQEAIANLQAQQSEIARERAEQISREVDAQAQQLAKMLEIKLNAGEINEEIGKTINRLREVETELAQLNARQAELEAAGAGLGYEEYDKNLAKIRELTDEQGRLNEKVAKYREEQSQVTESVSIWDRVGNLFKQIGNDLLHPIQRIRQLREGTDDAAGSANRAHPVFNKLLSTLGRMASSFILNVSGINRFKSAISGAAGKANGAVFSFRKLFTTLVASGIGIRSLYALFGQIKSAITENLKYFALMNNGMNQTNAAISSLQSSLNALKGALAGAFVPILNVVSPILSSLIDQLASVITAIGMFIAKLTGAKSYLRAVKKDTNYAAGLASGGGSSSDKKTAEERYQEAVEKAQKKYEEQLAKTREKNAKAQAKAEEKQAKAAEKLAKQQEKANKQLGAYDKLNVITTEELEDLEDIQADLYDEPELELPDMEDFLDDLKAAGGAASEDPFGFEEVPLDDWEFNWDDLKAKAEQLGRDLADKLNDFFKDEDFAKSLGHNIAEALNTALHFAYGFVDELDWRQMGHWLGTLVQEGLETFDWDLLGRTVGTTLNGIADAILGFFERYNAGTLGSKLSEALNGAIYTVDPVKLGTALNEVLKDPFIELSHFLTETNWSEAGRKFGIFLHNAITSKELNGMTLGETIGQTLADAVNAGIELLLAADVRQAIADITTFFGDIFRKAILGIEWQGIISVLLQGLIGLVQGMLITFGDFVVDWLEKKNPLDKAKLEQIRADYHAEIEEACRQVEEELTGTANVAEEQSERFTGALATMNEYVVEFPSSFADWGEALQNIQTEYQLTDDAMQTLIDTIITSNDYVDEQSELLEYGEDGWYAYKTSIEETSPALDTAKEKQEELSGAVEGVGKTAEETGGKVKDYVKIAADEMDAGKANAEAYESSVNSNLQGISDKSSEVELDFTTMTEQINAELEGLTLLVDEWYQNLLAQYFSYDNWYAMLQQGILIALDTFLNNDFFNNWDVNMKVWWETKVKPYFSAEKWNNEIFIPWKTNKDAKWNELMSWFDTQINDWWENKVKPMFEQSKWSEQFEHIKTAAEDTFSAVEETIVDHINNAKEAVLEACEEMKAAIAEVKAAMSSIGAGGGGGFRAGVGSTGWHSAIGGSSGYRGFMPMLDIMHFEDNLGMSAFQFPELATGAVIPPNNRFLAVLGDQKRGTNIETPLETMVEAFNRALDQRNASNHEPIVLQLNSEVIAEAVWDEEEKRYKQQGDYEPLYE